MFRIQFNLENQFGYPFNAVFGASGKTKHLQNVDNHFEWLKDNNESVKVWRECGDIKAISNKYNMDITVMIINKKGELELPLNSYEPDEEYKLEDDKETPKPKGPMMILVNKGDHYKLVVKNGNQSHTNQNETIKTAEETNVNEKQVEKNKQNQTYSNAIAELKCEVELLKEVQRQ